MNNGSSHPDPGLPAGPLDEAALLAYLEGELPAEPARRVALALAREPAWRDRLAELAADRRALVALPQEQAPEDLMARVAEQLERELLIGLGQGESAQAGPLRAVKTPPLAIRMGGRVRGWLRPLIDEPLGRKLALAAGLLLMAGGVGYLGIRELGNPGPGTPGIEPSRPLALAQPEIDAAPADAGAIATLAAAEPAPEIVPLTADTGVPLLADRRLGIRLVAQDPARAEAWVAGLSSTAGRYASRGAAPSLALALGDGAAAGRSAALARSMAQPEAARSLEAIAPDAGPAAQAPVLIEFELDGATLASFVRAAEREAGVRVELFELGPEAASLLEAPAGGIDDLLWWNAGPEHWTPRRIAPVVIVPVEPRSGIDN